MFQAEGKSIFPCSEKSNWVSFICFVTRPPFFFLLFLELLGLLLWTFNFPAAFVTVNSVVIGETTENDSKKV